MARVVLYSIVYIHTCYSNEYLNTYQRTNELIDMCLPTSVITFLTVAISHVQTSTCGLMHYTHAYPCHVCNHNTSLSLISTMLNRVCRTLFDIIIICACAQLIHMYSAMSKMCPAKIYLRQGVCLGSSSTWVYETILLGILRML